MADGDSGGDGRDDGDDESVLDQFEIGDTIGDPADSSNGHHDAGESADSGPDADASATGDATTDTDGDAGSGSGSGSNIPTPREQAPSSDTDIPTPREQAPPESAENGDAARTGATPSESTTSSTAEAQASAGGEGDRGRESIGPADFDGDGPAFREVQRFRQRWLWGIVVGVSVFSLVTWAFNSTGPLLTVVLFGLPAVGILATYAARLETEVHADGVHVRLFPLHRSARVVEFADVTGVGRKTFDAFSDYGGIGIRRTHDEWAYVVDSGEAVVLERAEQPNVVVGTGRPAELQRAAEVGLSLSRGVEGGLDERWRAVANFDGSSRIDD